MSTASITTMILFNLSTKKTPFQGKIPGDSRTYPTIPACRFQSNTQNIIRFYKKYYQPDPLAAALHARRLTPAADESRGAVLRLLAALIVTLYFCFYCMLSPRAAHGGSVALSPNTMDFDVTQ